MREKLEQNIGYRFKNKNFLEQALIHKSYGNENNTRDSAFTKDNERMEFLGDSLLNFVIARSLYETYKDCSEGELSRYRATIVNDKHLAQMATQYELGEFALLGKGEEQTGGREKESILANVLESLVAAIYLDSGIESVEQFVRKTFQSNIDHFNFNEENTDFKTKFQEMTQAQKKMTPIYEVLSTEGPDHDKTFEVRVLLGDVELARAKGKSKKEAEQNAAQLAIAQVGE